MKVFMLVNPAAGGGRSLRTAKEAARLVREAGADLEEVHSRSAEDLTRLARAAAEAADPDRDRIMVVGGDGSWHFALNGLAGLKVPATLIPCGRGNDFARNIGLSQKTPEAVRTALTGRIRDLDLIWTGVRHYIGVGGLGFDSEVTECANTRIPVVTGALAYTAAVLVKLFEFKPKWIKIVHDQGVFEQPVMFVVFSNSKSYGGGMKITPYAEMDDGLIDVVVVTPLSILDMLRTMPKVFSGRHMDHPAILFFRTTTAEVSSPEKNGVVRGRGIHHSGPGPPGNQACGATRGHALSIFFLRNFTSLYRGLPVPAAFTERRHGRRPAMSFAATKWKVLVANNHHGGTRVFPGGLDNVQVWRRASKAGQEHRQREAKSTGSPAAGRRCLSMVEA